MADTVTILNKETVAGGDAMDESLVPNPAGPGGLAKRARVVVGANDGRLVDVATDGGINKLEVKFRDAPLPAGASTEATLAAIKAKTDNLDVPLSSRTQPSDNQNVSVLNWPAQLGGGIEAQLFDFTTSPTVNYVGTAPLGTLPSQGAWRIKRLTFDVSGNLLEIRWSSSVAVWENRTNETYT